MTGRSEVETAFAAARELHRAGRLAEAEQAYRQLENDPAIRETVLQALFDLYLHSGRPQQAANTLYALIEEVPDSLTYHAHLANLLQRLGQLDVAIGYYERLLIRRPELADGHFSVALLYKQALRYREALAAYQKALELEIDSRQEVYSNMGVLYADMRNADKAREMYECALELDADYEPALFNLAGLLEEIGDREGATGLYERILELNPQHWDALARLAYASKLTGPDDPLIGRLSDAAQQVDDDRIAHEAVYFALGKALDEVGRYEEAYSAYRSANALGQERTPPYDKAATARGFDELIRLFDAEWVERNATGSEASPIFVCGMFRSGSTLVEQMLGAHPAVTAGGELDFLPWLIAHNLGPYPQRVTSVSADHLQLVGDEYIRKTQELFPDADNITDKRPDNFLHLGLIKAMFPRARIVYTRRAKPDNCLSILFQQLGGGLSYATDFGNTADYYDHHVRLMEHWERCLGDSIFTVDYDALVRDPEPALRALLEFLGLDWDARCLEFERSESGVKTASAWQVREGLYGSSSGRWKNYEAFIPELQ